MNKAYIELKVVYKMASEKCFEYHRAASDAAEMNDYGVANLYAIKASFWAELASGLVELPTVEMQPPCPDCNDTGVVPNASGTGEAAGGWGDYCECKEQSA